MAPNEHNLISDDDSIATEGAFRDPTRAILEFLILLLLLDLTSNAHRAFISNLLKICCRLVVFRVETVAFFFG